jgi:hypothetical protein
MKKIHLLTAVSFVFLFTACSSAEEEHIYTLYSTNYPHDSGRHGIATFDLVMGPEAGTICQEAADMYFEDFKKRKETKNLDESIKVRYWCEKGRFKK